MLLSIPDRVNIPQDLLYNAFIGFGLAALLVFNADLFSRLADRATVKWDTLLTDAVDYIEEKSSFGEHIPGKHHSDTIEAILEAARKGAIPVGGKSGSSQIIKKISKRMLKKHSLSGTSTDMGIDFRIVKKENHDESVYSALYTDKKRMVKVWPPHGKLYTKKDKF